MKGVIGKILFPMQLQKEKSQPQIPSTFYCSRIFSLESCNVYRLSNNPTTWCLYIVLLSTVGLLAFGNLFTQDFWDGADDLSIMKDIAALSQDRSFLLSANRGHDARPPFDLVILAGYLLWGESPTAFHMFHIALHILASLLVAKTLYIEYQNLDLSLLAGLLFLVNVTHFRAVHWITSINYVLALIFILFVWSCFKNYTLKKNKKWIILAVVFLMLAILTHPAALFITAFCGYRTWCQTASLRQTITLNWPLLIAAPILVFIAHIISVHGQSDAVLTTPSLSRIFTNLVWYVARLITTAHWITHTTSGNVANGWELGLGLLCLFGLFLIAQKRLIPPADWAVWILLSILPFLNNPPERLSVGPSRHLYFASVGSSVIIAWALQTTTQKIKNAHLSKIIFTGLIILTLSHSIVSLKKAEALSIYFTAISHKDQSLRLFEMAVSRAPDLVPKDIYTRMSFSGLTTGKMDLTILEAARQRTPNTPQLNILWAVTTMLKTPYGDHSQADKEIQNAIAQSNNVQEMQYYAAVSCQNLAVYFNQKNDLTPATYFYQKALFYYPNYPLALYSLADIYRVLHKTDQAIQAYQKVLELVPNHQMSRQRLQTLLHTKQTNQ